MVRAKRLDPLVIAGGLGSAVWDHDGHTHLDFSSQLVNTHISHQHPRVVEGIQQQADALATVAPGHANHTRGLAAERILAHAPTNTDKIFFTNGGARTPTKTYRSCHGNTGAAIAATGHWRRIPPEYSRGHVRVFGPYLYQAGFWAETPEQESHRALSTCAAQSKPKGRSPWHRCFWRRSRAPPASWFRRRGTLKASAPCVTSTEPC